VFITPRALITVRKDDFDIDALITRCDLNTELINAGKSGQRAGCTGCSTRWLTATPRREPPDLRAGYDGDFGEGVPPCR
jgi:hypothetical protein